MDVKNLNRNVHPVIRDINGDESKRQEDYFIRLKKENIWMQTAEKKKK